LLAACLALFDPAARAQSPGLDELLGEAAKWQSDTSRKPLLAISEIVRRASISQKRDIEQKFIALLKSDASLAGKDFICKELSVIGTDASAPALSAMLLDAKTSDMARYALERIPGTAADRALRDALGKSGGKTRIGIINSLGVRGERGRSPRYARSPWDRRPRKLPRLSLRWRRSRMTRPSQL
jgi:hypothetical protein